MAGFVSILLLLVVIGIIIGAVCTSLTHVPAALAAGVDRLFDRAATRGLRAQRPLPERDPRLGRTEVLGGGAGRTRHVAPPPDDHDDAQPERAPRAGTPPERYRLVGLNVPDIVDLTRTTTFGRTTGDVILKHHFVSGTHAVIQPGYGGWLLSDYNSLNGVFVNKERIASSVPRPLDPGDIISFAETGPQFRFEKITDPRHR